MNYFNFSFFRAPVTNTVPDVAFSIIDAYRYITKPVAQERTEQLRAMTSHDEAKRFKAENFDYHTFSGLFRTRSSSQLIQHSGLICVDFDDVEDILWHCDNRRYLKTVKVGNKVCYCLSNVKRILGQNKGKEGSYV